MTATKLMGKGKEVPTFPTANVIGLSVQGLVVLPWGLGHSLKTDLLDQADKCWLEMSIAGTKVKGCTDLKFLPWIFFLVRVASLNFCNIFVGF